MGKKRSLGLGLVLLVVAFFVLGLAGTAFAAPSTRAPVGSGGSGTNTPAVNKAVRIIIKADSATFALRYTNAAGTNGAYTYLIPWGINAATLETTIEGLAGASGDSLDVTVTGGPGNTTGSNPFFVKWVTPAGATKSAVGAKVTDAAGAQTLFNSAAADGNGTVAVATLAEGEDAVVAGRTAPTAPGTYGFTGPMPHGGYSAYTDYCMQCHNPHGPASAVGEALLNQTTVTAVCKTCHAIGTAAWVGAPRNPGFTGAESPASTEVAYALAAETSKPAGGSGHPIGTASISDSGTTSPMTNVASGWSSSWRSQSSGTTNTARPGQAAAVNSDDTTAPADGLQCSSCHTPHGNFGQLINYGWGNDTLGTGSSTSTSTQGWFWSSADGDGDHATDPAQPVKKAFAEGASFYNGGNEFFLHRVGTAPDTRPVVAYPLNQWEQCGQNPATIAVADFTTKCGPFTKTNMDSTVVSAAGYEMLTAFPNHQWKNPKSWGMDYQNHDQQGWCGTCHVTKVDSSYPSAYNDSYTTGAAVGVNHSHPTGCTSCHGNGKGITGAAADVDFPHQSGALDLLSAYPDALCINCHPAGGLP